jgi:hypothetical protein
MTKKLLKNDKLIIGNLKFLNDTQKGKKHCIVFLKSHLRCKIKNKTENFSKILFFHCISLPFRIVKTIWLLEYH